MIPANIKIICNCPDCLSRTQSTVTDGLSNRARKWGKDDTYRNCKHIFAALRYLNINTAS
jgi:hypothetical protein